MTTTQAIHFTADLAGAEQAAAVLRHCFERGDFDHDDPTEEVAAETEALARALADLSESVLTAEVEEREGTVTIDADALDAFLSVFDADERVTDPHAYRAFYAAAERANR